MSKRIYPFILLIFAGMSQSCTHTASETATAPPPPTDTFNYRADQFADLQVLRYQVPGFETLTAQQKELVYYLSQAALSGRDIFWDQNGKYNLTVRKTLENIIRTHKVGKKTEEYDKFLVYAKRVFFSSGIHHHYSGNKIQPEFSKEFFAQLIKDSNPQGLPMQNGESQPDFTKRITDIVFNPAIAPKRISLDSKKDLLKESSMNYYDGVSQAEAEAYYKKLDDPN
jgi:dipeptidyl-peptidase III